MNRASRSSSYSPAQIVLSSDARPALLFGVLAAVGQRGEHSRDAAQVALANLGHQLRLAPAARRARNSAPRDPRRPRRRHSASSTCWTCGLHEPQPVPARVASQSARRLRQPAGDRRVSCALGDAVAVADLRVVGQRPRADERRVAAHRAETAARRGCRAARAARSKACCSAGAPSGSPSRIAPGQPAVADDHLLVDAARRLGVAARPRRLGRRLLVAHHGEIDAHHLELGRHARAAYTACALRAGQPIGEHLRLFPQRRDQPVDLAAVLRALADRVDVRVVRRRADRRRRRCRARRSGRPRAPARRSAGCRPTRPPSRSRAVEPSSNCRPVTAASPRTAVVRRARCVVTPSCSMPRCSISPAVVVELHVHQVRHQVDDVHLDARSSRSPRAASSPSRPPPITAARARRRRRSCGLRAQSSSVRKTKTPSR